MSAHMISARRLVKTSGRTRVFDELDLDPSPTGVVFTERAFRSRSRCSERRLRVDPPGRPDVFHARSGSPPTQRWVEDRVLLRNC